MNLRLSILLIALAFMAVPAFAQFELEREITGETGDGGGWSDAYSYSSGVSLDNPCTAWYDQVWVDYNVYLAQEGETVGTGERVLFNENTTMGGSTYAASGSSTSDVIYRQYAYTLRKYHKVNTSDAFHVVTVIDFDPATNSSYLSIETACGDGTPSSAQ